jgi:hypothetical protein
MRAQDVETMVEQVIAQIASENREDLGWQAQMLTVLDRHTRVRVREERSRLAWEMRWAGYQVKAIVPLLRYDRHHVTRLVNEWAARHGVPAPPPRYNGFPSRQVPHARR